MTSSLVPTGGIYLFSKIEQPLHCIFTTKYFTVVQNLKAPFPPVADNVYLPCAVMSAQYFRVAEKM